MDTIELDLISNWEPLSSHEQMVKTILYVKDKLEGEKMQTRSPTKRLL